MRHEALSPGTLLGFATTLVVVMASSAPAALAGTERITLDGGGRQVAGASVGPTLSADGHLVAFSSQASTLVAGDDNGTYFGTVDGRVQAYERSGGARLWEVAAAGPVSSPAVVGTRVLIGSGDGTLRLLDGRTGQQVWSATIGGARWVARGGVRRRLCPVRRRRAGGARRGHGSRVVAA